MLETRNLPLSPRTRRLDAPRTSSAASQVARALSPARSQGNAALGQVQPAPRPAVRPAAPARQSRLGRSEMRLMGAATTCTAVVCGLLLLYLAAYAHVTRLGIDQSQALACLRDNRLRNEMLRAERDRLQSPQYVINAAIHQGMTPRGATPVEYIAAPSRTAQVANRIADSGPEGEQGTNGGTTADSSTSTSFGH